MPHHRPLPLRFDRFELDEEAARLTREGRPIALPPKAFDVLCTLARQPGRLMTKDMLLDAVWGHRHVSESVLKSTISALRAALSDDARQPRYIETASRRGYRFIGALAPGAAMPLLPEEDAADPDAPGLRMVGRQAALAQLRAAWRAALGGRRQTVWIVGEAGIGKTTLIDHFAGSLGMAVCVRGQCVEQFGPGEPYLPVLEALAALCRDDPALVSTMRAVAPTWLLQMPWLSDQAEREALRRESAGGSQHRMLRELAELLDRYTHDHPLLLITEDLHWSDRATLQLMDHLTRRRQPSRLMWLASFRLAEVLADAHPLKLLRHELRLHKLCEEIALAPFAEDEVATYLGQRLPPGTVPAGFARLLQDRTDGLPLFVASVVDDLLSQPPAEPGASESPGEVWPVPANLAGVIEGQIERLPDAQQRLLEAASACGVDFRTDLLAAALEEEPAQVVAQCADLARRQQWLGGQAVDALPDGTLEVHCTFRHALYRHVFYQRSGLPMRALWHRRIAQAMERQRDAGAAVAAAELALHFELGHDWMPALRYYGVAAESALSHFAPAEAMALTEHALSLLPRCPDGMPRDGLELGLVAPRAVACSQLHGVGSPEAQAVLQRAQALCDVLPDTPLLGWVLCLLGWMRGAAAQYDGATPLATRIMALTERFDEPALLASSCALEGSASAYRGDLDRAREWLERGIAVAEAAGARPSLTLFITDPLVWMRATLGVCLMLMGLPEQAQQQVEAALTRARAVGRPLDEVQALRCAGMLEVWLERPEQVEAVAEQLDLMFTERAIVQAEWPGCCLGGWAMAGLGEATSGYGRVLEGIAAMQRIGMISSYTLTLCLAAETAALAGRLAEAQGHADEGVRQARASGERLFLPALLLQQGRIALQAGQPEQAQAAMQASVLEARMQGALGQEINALAALCERSPVSADDLEALADACAQLTEGFDTAPVQRAFDLLRLHQAELSSSV